MISIEEVSDKKIADLVQTLHYNERYQNGSPSLQAIRVEVDTALYALYRERLHLAQRVESAWYSVHHTAGDKRVYDYVGNRSVERWGMAHDEAEKRAQAIADNDITYTGTRAKEALQDLATAREALKVCRDRQQVLHSAYKARPWTRAFLVTDGHVHSSMECSTCFPTTEFSWLVQFADHNEAEIVEAAGERACTVCYPTAPTLREFQLASPLFTEEEEARNKAREERKDAKAARQAKKVAAGLTPDGSEFTVITEEGIYPADHHIRQYAGQHYTRKEHFKTEKAAVQWVVANRASGYPHLRTETIKEAETAIIAAVARKHGKSVEEVTAEIQAKTEAKRKRDARDRY